MDQSYESRNANRTLSLFVPELPRSRAKLVEFCRETDSCRVEVDAEIVHFHIGESSAFRSIVDILSFLRGLIPEEQLEHITAAWTTGRDRISTAEMARLAQPFLAMASQHSGELVNILKHNRVETWYQPIFSSGKLDLWGYECLLRGRNAAGRIIGPMELISWARQENLMFMFDRVCRDTHLINAGRAAIPATANLLINFMPTTICEPASCLKSTMDAARQSGIDASRIIFEVVEHDQVTDRKRLGEILRYYHEQGYRVALDDTGSGYASLSLLADLDPDLIKIDRALIQKSVTSSIHRAVCESLVCIGKRTGKIVLAEGVETSDEMRVMNELGVDLFQGFYFGKPSPIPVTQPLIRDLRLAA